MEIEAKFMEVIQARGSSNSSKNNFLLDRNALSEHISAIQNVKDKLARERSSQEARLLRKLVHILIKYLNKIRNPKQRKK